MGGVCRSVRIGTPNTYNISISTPCLTLALPITQLLSVRFCTPLQSYKTLFSRQLCLPFFPSSPPHPEHFHWTAG